MDSIPRKRKLSEYGRNVSSPKGSVFTKTPITAEENEYGISQKCQRMCQTSKFANTSEDTLLNVVPESPQQKLETIEEVSLKGSEKQGSKNLGNECSFYLMLRSKQNNSDNNGAKIDTIWYNTDYIEDIICYEMHKESLYHLSGNFCRKFEINPTGREILIDWLISVQVSVKAENSVFHLAVSLLDVLLDSVHVPLSEMQAAAIAAFWVAYKFIQGNISMKTLLSFCAGSVTKNMIRENEILVLQTSRLIEAGGSLSFMFVDCTTYEKAATAAFSALSVFGAAGEFDRIDLSRFITKSRLQQVYRRLMRSLKLMYYDKSSLKNYSVYVKYKSSRYCRISVHQNLKRLATA